MANLICQAHSKSGPSEAYGGMDAVEHQLGFGRGDASILKHER